MQKNKFIHEDIKAICNSTTKKLVACGLVMTIVGTGNPSSTCKLIGYAQFPEQYETTEEYPQLRDVHQRLERLSQNGHNVERLLRLTNTLINHVQQPLSEHQLDEVYAYLTNRLIPQVERLESPLFNRISDIWRGFVGQLSRLWDYIGFARNRNREAIVPQLEPFVDTNQMIRARENQYIEAGPNTHVYSFSDNELTHEGAGLATITGTGGVDIDVGDVTVSECKKDLRRNVTVNQANSLTVASGILMRTRNDEWFPMGETLQETAENILRELSPNSRQEILSKFGSSSGGK